MEPHEQHAEEQELRTRYAGMSNEELSALARVAYDLSEDARELLNREFITRGLQPPVPVLEAIEGTRPVVLERFINLHEALLAKGQLDSCGVPCFLLDDNMIRIDWFISNLLGGVKLAVLPEHEEEAREIMAQPIPEDFDVEGVGSFQQPHCLKCQSLDISYESLDKPYAYGSAWLGFPIPFGASRWRCHACGAVWQGTQDDIPSESTDPL